MTINLKVLCKHYLFNNQRSLAQLLELNKHKNNALMRKTESPNSEACCLEPYVLRNNSSAARDKSKLNYFCKLFLILRCL